MSSRIAASKIAPRIRLRPPFPTGRLPNNHRLLVPQPSLHLQQQQQRQIHFLPFLGLWGAKHLSAWTLYNAGRNYGWTRVYRRLLEQNRRFNIANPSMRQQTQKLIRLGIEAPVQFAAQIAQQAQVIMPFLNELVERATPNIPSFLVTLAKYIINSQKPVKIMQDLASSAAKRASK